jgi:hypothetical protein
VPASEGEGGDAEPARVVDGQVRLEIDHLVVRGRGHRLGPGPAAVGGCGHHDVGVSAPPRRRRQLYPLSHGGPSGTLPPSEPAQADTSVRRQGGVSQTLRPTRLGLLAARLHGKARPQVAGVAGETQQARHGDKQEQADEHQSEHGKNCAVAKK